MIRGAGWSDIACQLRRMTDSDLMELAAEIVEKADHRPEAQELRNRATQKRLADEAIWEREREHDRSTSTSRKEPE